MGRGKFAGELVCLADRDLLAGRAHELGWEITLRDYDPQASRPHELNTLTVLHRPLSVSSRAGHLDKRNASYVLGLLDRAVEGACSGEFPAMVPAPVPKGITNAAGTAFTGHTEYLAGRTRSALPVMLLASPAMRVALATTHLPLREVSSAITIEPL